MIVCQFVQETDASIKLDLSIIVIFGIPPGEGELQLADITSLLFVSQSHHTGSMLIPVHATSLSIKVPGVVSPSQAFTFSSLQSAFTIYFKLQLSSSSHSSTSTVILSHAATTGGQTGSSLTVQHSLVSTLRQSGLVDIIFIVHLLLHPPSPQQGLQQFSNNGPIVDVITI